MESVPILGTGSLSAAVSRTNGVSLNNPEASGLTPACHGVQGTWFCAIGKPRVQGVPCPFLARKAVRRMVEEGLQQPPKRRGNATIRRSRCSTGTDVE